VSEAVQGSGDIRAGAAATGFDRGRPQRRSWPLSRTLPLGVALAMFVVALATSLVGLRIMETRELNALESKALIFLNALADTAGGLLAAGPEAVEASLQQKLLLREALVEELLVLRWTGAGDLPEGELMLARESAADPALAVLLAKMAAPAINELIFSLDREREMALAAKAYLLDGRTLTIAAALDTQHIHAAARRAERWALLIDLGLAALAALLTYAVTRRAMAPLHRLALSIDKDAALPERSTDRRWSAEVERLEAAVQARLEAEAARTLALRDIGERDRNALLAKLAAGLAHEVRNPLAGLLNAVSTLRRFGADAKVRGETLDLIERGLRSIGRVADTMLTTYRPEAGRATFTAADLDDLRLLISPEAIRRQVTLDWRVGEFRPVAVDADALRQILLNLLLNACRASTDGGTIVFSVEQDPSGQAGGEHSFVVTDSGPGMPDSVLAFLVDGARLAPMVDQKGLGLWLVTRLLEDIGGRIKVESRSGRGTSVVVRLPERAVATAAEPTIRVPAA
jgi:signal transduction histidine kinase